MENSDGGLGWRIQGLRLERSGGGCKEGVTPRAWEEGENPSQDSERAPPALVGGGSPLQQAPVPERACCALPALGLLRPHNLNPPAERPFTARAL
jgi:hypothetical protein